MSNDPKSKHAELHAAYRDASAAAAEAARVLQKAAAQIERIEEEHAAALAEHAKASAAALAAGARTPVRPVLNPEHATLTDALPILRDRARDTANAAEIAGQRLRLYHIDRAQAARMAALQDAVPAALRGIATVRRLVGEDGVRVLIERAAALAATVEGPKWRELLHVAAHSDADGAPPLKGECGQHGKAEAFAYLADARP